jgi:hypothetical protein
MIEGGVALKLLRNLPIALSWGLMVHCGAADPPATRPKAPQAGAVTDPAFSLNSLEGLEAGDNRLFLAYDPNGEVRWNKGWPGQVDLTGVAWDSPRTATAITARHVVMAAHYSRKIDDTLVFHDHDGKRHARTLVNTVSLGGPPNHTDITVGLLDRPLPDQIKTYPLLEPATDYADRLAGGLVLVTDHERRLFIHEIMFVSTKSLRFTFSPECKESMQKSLFRGDSGNPSFLWMRGEPVFVETHTMGGAGAGPFYSAPTQFQALKEAMKNLDPRYPPRVVPLDPAYAREAAARRTKRPHYTRRNTDGSLRKDAPPKGKPGTNSAPRVRRVPSPSTP